MNMRNVNTPAIIAGVVLLVLVYWGLYGDDKAIKTIDQTIETQVKPQNHQPPISLKVIQTTGQSTPKTPPRESDDLFCKNLLKPNNKVASWKIDKLSAIKSFVSNQLNLGASEQVLDLFFVNSGIGLYVGRNILTGYDPAIRKRPPYHQADIIRASIQAHILAKSSVAGNDLAKLLSSINSSKLPSTTYYRGEKGPVFLLSYLLENANTDIDNLANLLVDNGIKVTYSDLVNVTKMGLKTATVERLYSDSGLQATKVLSHKNRNSSLVLTAIAAHNAELAMYWLNMGSPSQPDPLDGNALDLLAEQGSKFHPDAATELFTTLVDAGLSPLKKASVARLKALIPPELFELYQAQLQTQSTILSAEETAQSEMLVNKVHTTILSELTKFELGNEPKHHCFSELGKLLTEFVVRVPRRGKISEPKKQPSKPNKIDVEALIARAQRLHNNPDGVLFELSNEQSLLNKQAIEQYRRKELTELMKGVKEQVKQKPEDNSQKAIIRQIMQLAQQGKWPEVFQLLATLKSRQSEVRSALVYTAIISETDFVIIEQLLDGGTKLLESVMTPLISKNNVELARQLLPYGLDLNYVEMGYSTLARSVQWQALDMLKFLLVKGVPIDTDAQGFDSLDLALKQFDYKMTGFTYVSLLISAGANIELSHKQIVDELKVRDLEGYSRLTSQFPQLKL
ncbi:MAG: hypothetical protein ACI8WB_000220 [Phenylobacterium sp.]|jgi:hypothetical protein